MKIKWNVDLPNYRSPIPDQIEEINQYISDTIYDEFTQRVSYYWEILK